MDLLYRVEETHISPELIEWLGYPNSLGVDEIEFYRHLLTFRKAIANNVDSAIILSPNVKISSHFENVFEEIVEEFEQNVVLLSHYVSNWSTVQSVRSLEHGEFCTVSDDVNGFFAYWISREWMERCLHLYDRPRRYLAPIPLSVSLLVRSPDTEMLRVPLFYRTDTIEYSQYFEYYGLH